MILVTYIQLLMNDKLAFIHAMFQKVRQFTVARQFLLASVRSKYLLGITNFTLGHQLVTEPCTFK